MRLHQPQKVLNHTFPQNSILTSPLSLLKFSYQNSSTLTSEFCLFAYHFQSVLICTVCMSEKFLLTTFRSVFAVNSVIILIRFCILKHLLSVNCQLMPSRIFQDATCVNYGMDILWNFLSLNPLILKSDKVLISPYNNTPESNVQVTRIKEMISI